MNKPTRSGIYDPWVPHVVCEGSRQHVISYDTYGERCSHPRCEKNRRRPDNKPETLEETEKQMTEIKDCLAQRALEGGE